MEERLEKLRREMEKRGLGCCIINRPVNIYYFSNVFPREPAFLIIPKEEGPKLITAPSDFKYAEERSIVEIVKGRMNILSAAKDVAKGLGCLSGAFYLLGKKSVGIEADFLGVGILNALGLEKYSDISPVIARMRSIKSGDEIKNIKKSVEISEKAMGEVFEKIEEGMTEKEISGHFDYAAKVLGAGETKARVSSGENTAMAFRWLSDDVIKSGPLLIDYGTTWEKYWTDIARTFYVGKPDKDFEDVYEAVLDALKEGTKVARAGEEIAGLDGRVREVLKEHGYEKYIIYSSGHGCGLEHEEPPIITGEKIASKPKVQLPLAGGETEALFEFAGKEKETFKENMVITLEPGVYLEKFGVRIEDMILIGKSSKVLSSFPRSPESIAI